MTRARIAVVLAVVALAGCATPSTPSPRDTPPGTVASPSPGTPRVSASPEPTPGTTTSHEAGHDTGSDRVALTGTVVAEPGCPGPQRAGVKCPARPVGGAPVTLTTSSGATVAQTKTDSSGKFRLMISLGSYVITARNVGYRSAARRPIAIRGPMEITLVVDSGLR